MATLPKPRDVDRTNKASILLEVARSVGSTLDLDEVLTRVVEGAATATGADLSGLWLLDEEARILRPMALYGMDPEFTANWRTRPLSLEREPLSREAIATGQPVVVDDAGRDPRTDKDAVAFFGDKSILVVPLVHRGRVLGTLFLNHVRAQHIFSPEEIELAQAIAGLAATAIENARLYQDEQARRRIHETLLETSIAITSSLDLSTVLDTILTQLKRVVDYDSACIQLVEGEAFRIIAGRGYEDTEQLLRLIFTAREDSVETFIMTHRTPILSADVTKETRFRWKAGETKVRSWMGLPLLIGEQLIGLLSVDKHTVNSFTERDVQAAMPFAYQAAVAIQNARLFHEMRQRVAELQALHEVGMRLSSSLDLPKVLQDVTTIVLNLVHADAASVHLYDPTSDTFQFRVGYATRDPACPHPLPRRDGVTALVARQGQPVIISDTAHHPLYAGADQATRDLKSIASFPLKTGGRVTGVLDVVYYHPHPFSESETRLLSTFADQAAMAVANAHMYEELRRHVAELEERAKRLALVNQVSNLVTASLDVSQILQTVVNGLARVIVVDQGAVALISGDGTYAEVVAEYLSPGCTSALGVRLPVPGNPTFAAVRETQQPLVIPDAQHDPLLEPVRDIIRWRRTKSMLIVPLLAHGELLGTIGLDTVTEARTFSPEDVELAQTLTNQAATAIMNARFLSETVKRAAELRESFRTMGAALAARGDLDETLAIVLNQAMRILRADAAGLALVGEDGSLIYRIVEGGSGHAVVTVMPGHDLMERVIRRGAVVVMPRVKTQESILFRSLGEGEHSFLGVPLRLHGRTIGGIGLVGRGTRVFSDDDIQFIATFADQAAVAIEEAQLVAAVVREKSRIEAIVQHSVDGILATDTSLRITDANRALETMLGIPRTDMLGAPCREVLQCTDEAGASMCTDQCPLDRALRSGQPVRVEMHIRTRNGRLLDIGMSCGLVQDEHGEPSQIVAVVRDVSQEKQIERLRSDFVSTVSHELRTPLALIKGYVATLLRRDVPLSPEAQERFLLRINEAADRLGRLIDNVLSASRIEAGRFVLRCHPFDLADLVEKVASSMQPFDQSHRIVVQAPLPLDGSRTARQGLIVHADQDKIEQVLINLISNAMKYSPAGTAITIAVRRLTQTSDVDLLRQQVPTTPAGCSVPAALVSVSDQGPGIPLEHQEHLFEKFYRVEGGLGRRASGSGLGLYICRTIVEAHGGCIWVRSAPDTGSTFFFTIPLPSE